jgi:hypothetical protein
MTSAAFITFGAEQRQQPSFSIRIATLRSAQDQNTEVADERYLRLARTAAAAICEASSFITADRPQAYRHRRTASFVSLVSFVLIQRLERIVIGIRDANRVWV